MSLPDTHTGPTLISNEDYFEVPISGSSGRAHHRSRRIQHNHPQLPRSHGNMAEGRMGDSKSGSPWEVSAMENPRGYEQQFGHMAMGYHHPRSHPHPLPHHLNQHPPLHHHHHPLPQQQFFGFPLAIPPQQPGGPHSDFSEWMSSSQQFPAYGAYPLPQDTIIAAQPHLPPPPLPPQRQQQQMAEGYRQIPGIQVQGKHTAQGSTAAQNEAPVATTAVQTAPPTPTQQQPQIPPQEMTPEAKRVWHAQRLEVWKSMGAYPIGMDEFEYWTGYPLVLG